MEIDEQLKQLEEEQQEQEKIYGKPEKTPTQLKRKYRNISRGCFIGQFLAIFAPFITIGIVNYEEYFVQYDGTKMSIAAVLAAILMGVATWLVAKKKITNPYIAILVGWATVTAIFYFLGNIINDIAHIMLFGWIGLAGAFGLDLTSIKFEEKARKIQEGIDAANQQMTKDAYIEEVQAKKVKVKVKVKK